MVNSFVFLCFRSSERCEDVSGRSDSAGPEDGGTAARASHAGQGSRLRLFPRVRTRESRAAVPVAVCVI